jgi:hypothetical protein
MAAPKKKPPVKKAPAKKTPKIIFRNIAPEPKKKIVFKTTKDDSPKKSQSAKDLKSGGLRAQHLQEAKNEYNTARNNKLLDLENKNKEIRRRNKITKFRIKTLDSKIDDLKKVMTKYGSTGGSSVATKGTGLLKGTVKKIPVVGAALGFIADAAPAGEGSTKDKYSTLKKKYSSAIGPTKPKTRSEIPANERAPGRGPGVYGDIARERTVKYNPGDYAKYRSGQGTTSVRPTTTRPKPMNTKVAPSTYTGYGTWNAPKKSGSSDAFTLGSGAQMGGGNPVSRAAPKPNLRPRKVASSAPVARLSRTEREGLSTDRMQRKPKGNLLGFLKKRK